MPNSVIASVRSRAMARSEARPVHPSLEKGLRKVESSGRGALALAGCGPAGHDRVPPNAGAPAGCAYAPQNYPPTALAAIRAK